MKHSFPYKAGDVITIYDDWENELLPLGTATLIEFVSDGRSFILEEMMPESLQEVYSFQTWLANVDGNKEKVIIRFLDSVGIANSADDEKTDDEIEQLPKDSFLEVNGVQIY